jgi:hypothetical protein
MNTQDKKSFLVVLEFELILPLAKQALYHLNYAPRSQLFVY